MKHRVNLFITTLFLLAGVYSFAGSGAAKGIEAALANPNRFEFDKKRDITSKPKEVLAFFGLEEGMNVADVFGGGGYFSELMAAGVGPKGKIYLHNNQAYWNFIGKETEKRTANNRLPNVVQLRTETADMKLPEGELDMVIIVLGYHDLFYSGQGWPQIDAKSFMGQIKKALKPGGVLGIIDHCAREGSGADDAQKLHRIDKDFCKKDIIAHGFKFEAELDILRNSDDDHTLMVTNPQIRRKTDRFVYRFTKQ